MKFRLSILGAFIVSVFLFGQAQPAAAVNVWTAKYWNNRNLEGDPIITRNESGLSHDWGDGSPDPAINTDSFSAEWSTATDFNAGTYRFTATVDDGMRVYVDGTKIIDVWYDSQQHDVVVDRYMSAGRHSIVVQYYEAGAKAVAKVGWQQVSSGGGVNANGLWTAEYFNNTDLSGFAARTQRESAIDYVWGGSPATDVNADNFSVRWSGAVPVDSGTYRFSVRADDGVRLWVNGRQIINQWQEQPATDFSADIVLNGGSVPVTMEYFDRGGTGVAALSWSKISSSTNVQPVTPPQSFSQWKGEYFNNVNLSGSPVLTRNDQNINFDWGSSSPVPNVVNHDTFAVRWTRTVNLRGGSHSYKIFADDGVRMWVNDQIVVDQWTTTTGTPITGSVNIPGGSTRIRVEYFELTGLADMRLDWAAVSSAQTVPPTTNTGSSSSSSSSNVDSTSTAPPGAAVLQNARTLRLRAGPGITFDTLGFISRGETLGLIGRNSGAYWIKVQHPNGQIGWAGARFLSSPTNFNDLPLVR